eukprot:IDg4138t1
MLTRLGDNILTQEPLAMMATIAAHFEADATPAMHEALRVRAESMRIKPRETFDDYFERHLMLRSEMVQAKYPTIDNETTTVSYIIRGLAARPNYQPHITTMMLNMPLIIREARVAVEVLETSVRVTGRAARGGAGPSGAGAQRLHWCDFHQAYTNHNTTRCRDRQRALARQPRQYQTETPPARRAPQRPYDTHRQQTRGRPGLHPRAAAARTYSLGDDESLAAEEEIPPGDSIGWIQEDDNNKTGIRFSSYIVDSGCFPSFATSNGSGLPPCHKQVELPDGSLQRITAQGPTILRSRQHAALALPRLCVVPSFQRNLLSVGETTRANKCVV